MRNKISTKINSVLIIGLGRIGLPQALILANSGIKVHAFDQNAVTAQSCNDGEIPFYEPHLADYLKKNIHKTFFPSANWKKIQSILPEIDAIIFTIGTKVVTDQDILNKKSLHINEYFTLLDKLFSNKTSFKKGIKLIFRTTLPLGSTNQLKNYLETQHALKEGKDFYLAFVPERIIEGSAIDELLTIPIIVGVYSDEAFIPISNLFKPIGSKIIRVKNPITAEFCKLTDNTFRSTMFGYANEIAMYANQFGIDADEVINAVNDHYERNHIPRSGFVSGYCLSKDPYIFELDFLKNDPYRDFHSVWYYARKTNDYLINFIVKKIISHFKNIKKSHVVILGLSFKEDVDDFRMSHAFKIIEMLIAVHVNKISVYDPNLEKNKYTALPDSWLPYIVKKSDTVDMDLFDGADAIIICDRHHVLCDLNNTKKLANLLKNTKNPCYLLDAWNIWKAAKDIKHIHYESISSR